MLNKNAIQTGIYDFLKTSIGSYMENRIYFETIPDFGKEGYSLNDNGYPELDVPYVVYYIDNNIPEYTFTSTSEVFSLEVKVIDQNPSPYNINIIEDALCDAMDRAEINTVTGYTTVKCFRTFSNTMAINGVWQHTSRYNIELQEE
jgi:hypothetical protein